MQPKSIALRVQDVLHCGNSLAFPSLLMTIAGGCIVYQHANQRTSAIFDPVKTFMTMVCMQMVTLVILESKVLKANDPMALLYKFGPKVLLMHLIALVLRALHEMAGDDQYTKIPLMNLALTVGALVALRVGFDYRWSISSFIEHGDVWCLTLLVLTFAYTSENIAKYISGNTLLGLDATIQTASSYLELLAFVPAIQTSIRMARGLEKNIPPPTKVTEKFTLCFLAYIMVFYIYEDFGGAFKAARRMPFVVVVLLVHFLLLLDFSAFLFAHIYDPNKLYAKLVNWFPDAGLV